MTTALSKCESPTRFFKFIPPGCISQLSVPIAFRKYLKRIRKTKPALLKRGNQNWLVKINDDWVFGDGWEDFVTGNGLQEFEFVIFKHEGNMVFDTMVFDLNGREKEYPTYDQVKEKKKEKTTSSLKSKIDASRLPKETTKVNVIENPSFKSVLTASCLKENYVCIPMGFARSTKLVNKNCESIMVDENGDVWATKLRSRSDRLHVKGMGKIWVKNGFKKGDEFLLEVVDNREKPIMKLYKVVPVLL